MFIFSNGIINKVTKDTDGDSSSSNNSRAGDKVSGGVAITQITPLDRTTTKAAAGLGAVTITGNKLCVVQYVVFIM